MTTLRLGTRASALARTQSEQVAALVRAHTGREVELVDITTEGDTSTATLASLGGLGVFVGALREALLDGPGRPRRALAQGPADGARRGPHAGRRASARGPARRRGRS